FAHQDVPFERLVEEIAPSRSMARHPLFQTVLTMQDAIEAAPGRPGLPAARPAGETTSGRAAKFDLDVMVGEAFDPQGAPAGLHGTVTVAADLFDAEWAGRIADYWAGLLAFLADDRYTRLSAVEVLGAGERRRVLTDWNDTATGSEVRRVCELFGEQVVR
ncbi:non-ribosomal peptide synthetase, partial [Streptomyces sp. SID7499]|nr:non-ribosomal peptide synthetase [Streptomyces sp. SID7499]